MLPAPAQRGFRTALLERARVQRERHAGVDVARHVKCIGSHPERFGGGVSEHPARPLVPEQDPPLEIERDEPIPDGALEHVLEKAARIAQLDFQAAGLFLRCFALADVAHERLPDAAGQQFGAHLDGDEPALREPLEVVADVGQVGGRPGEGHGDGGGEIDPLGLLGGQEEREERVMLRLGRVQPVVAAGEDAFTIGDEDAVRRMGDEVPRLRRGGGDTLVRPLDQCSRDDQQREREPDREHYENRDGIPLVQHRHAPVMRVSCGRQHDGRGGAAARSAGDRQFARHLPRQVPRDRQPEADAGKTPRRAALGLEERLEHLLHGVLRDSNARIAHPDAHASVDAIRPQRDDPAILGVLRGVGEQADEDLLQPLLVRPHGKRRAVNVALHEVLSRGAGSRASGEPGPRVNDASL